MKQWIRQHLNDTGVRPLPSQMKAPSRAIITRHAINGSACDFKFKRLAYLMKAAIQKADDGTCKRISDALAPVLPEVLSALRDIVIDKESSSSIKLQCSALIMSMWSRCVHTEQYAKRAAISQAKFRAHKAIADAEYTIASTNNKKVSLAIMKRKKAIARKVRQANKHIGIGTSLEKELNLSPQIGNAAFIAGV